MPRSWPPTPSDPPRWRATRVRRGASLNVCRLGQTLYCTEGEGFVQARGGPLIRLRLGDIVITEPNEWHRHGATSNRLMVHLAFTEGDTEWGDHLTDEESRHLARRSHRNRPGPGERVPAP